MATQKLAENIEPTAYVSILCDEEGVWRRMHLQKLLRLRLLCFNPLRRGGGMATCRVTTDYLQPSDGFQSSATRRGYGDWSYSDTTSLCGI